MEVAILLTLVLLNGLLAMSEIALVTARKGRLQRFIEEGDKGAQAAVQLGQDPTRFLSTIQIGITSIGILNGIVGEAALAGPLRDWLVTLGLRERPADYAATALVVVVVTYVSIVAGELVPKRLAQFNPERLARLVARPIAWLATASGPFVKVLSGSTDIVLRLLGAHRRNAPMVTDEEIDALLVEGSEAGVIEPHEHTMVRELFRLDDRTIGSFMIPRSDIVFIDVSRPVDENLARAAEHEHSRYPVVRDGWHEVLGIVYTRTILSRIVRQQPPDFESVVTPALYVPESATGLELLENFRSSAHQEALVVDEYGEVLGLVTLRDLIEGITGELGAPEADESWAIQRDDGSWLLDGLIPIPEMKDRLRLKTVPEEDRERYHTLSGMLLLLLGRVPRAGDRTKWDGWRFEIVDMDGNRIDKVLASAIEAQEKDA